MDLFAFEWDPAGAEQLDRYTTERLTDLIRLATGASALAPRITKVGAVTFGAFIAERVRDGSTFLIGDAARGVTPAEVLG